MRQKRRCRVRQFLLDRYGMARCDQFRVILRLDELQILGQRRVDIPARRGFKS